MSEKTGHFEKGRWVEDTGPEPAGEAPAGEEAASAPESKEFKNLFDETTQSVQKAVDDVIRLGKHLFMTKEGREHIEKTARKAGADLERTIDDMAETAKKTLERRK